MVYIVLKGMIVDIQQIPAVGGKKPLDTELKLQ
jgi:hypothetical protein